MSLDKLKSDLKIELLENILPFWSQQMIDEESGGFIGRINGDNKRIFNADKGGILNARILWTFSAAYIHTNNNQNLVLADRAYKYISDNFFDEEFGGTFWSLKYDGTPNDTKKQIYSQAFFIYSLTEYYKASNNEESLNKAIELFRIIEKYSFDNVQNGYYEAYSRQWKLLDDLRLSEKDANEKKTMNTHLHILEAYTNLYGVWKDELLKQQLINLVELFSEKIVDKKTKHLGLFFDENWQTGYNIVSYGHDIEASWLIDEAAKAIGDINLVDKVQSLCLGIAEAACEGLAHDGSLFYEKNCHTNHTDTERHWWVQAEAVVGFVNAYKLTQNENWLLKAEKCWEYISNNLIDRVDGEWYWSVYETGSKNKIDDKAGFWKCPYHNSRMCFEII